MSAAAWAVLDIALLALWVAVIAGLTWAGRWYNHRHQPLTGLTDNERAFLAGEGDMP